jgi:hypothetical protein
MPVEVKDIAKDTWVKVLTNVKFEGQVFPVDLEEDPTSYLVTLVNTGETAPALDFSGGVPFQKSFAPAHEPEAPVTGSDYYVLAKDRDGKVVIIT